MTLTFYHYAKCGTCIKAKKYLAAKGYSLQEIDITTAPPPEGELTKLIAKSGRPYTAYLNTSGVQYREKNMKEKVKQLPEKEIVAMLAAEGRLLKRPIVTDGKTVTVGFSEDDFSRAWPGGRSRHTRESGYPGS